MPELKDAEASVTRIEGTWGRLAELAKSPDKQFDGEIFRNARVIDASRHGNAVFEFDIGEKYSNGGNIMHGGAAALLFDIFTTAAFLPMMAESDIEVNTFAPPGGLTRALNITYLRPLPLPATVRIRCDVVQFGKITSLVRGSITSKEGDKTYVTCEHHKISKNLAQKPVRGGTKL